MSFNMPIKIYKTDLTTPLVVDLDGTLLRTDSLYECSSKFILSHPLNFFIILSWLWKGIAYLKTKLFTHTHLDPTCLPFNQALLAWIKKQKQSGRRIILATATHEAFAKQISKHTGLFDLVLASSDSTNLKGIKKRDALVGLFGKRGFDYVGNSYADIPIWLAARKSYVVSSSQKFIVYLKNIINIEYAFPSRSVSMILTIAKVLRLHQWIKNILIFLPLFAAQKFTDVTSVKQCFISFFLFGLTASSVYILNDISDIEDDRHHKYKRNRPFAAGDANLISGWIAWPCILIVAFSLSLIYFSWFFLIVLASYFIITLAYSFLLKKIAMLDVITLASLYTLRIIAGGASIDIDVTFWLLAFSIFVFLSLAFIKRYSEIMDSHILSPKKPIRGRGYNPQDLQLVSTMGITSGYLSILILALYIQDPQTIRLYSSPQFVWLACPILLYWITYLWLLAHRGLMHQDPLLFAIQDKVSWIAGVLFVGVFALAKTI